jgi:hypothetical protein
VNVRLSWGEITVAAVAGALRNVTAMKNGRRNGYGLGSAAGWNEHCDGALAEAALAKALDRYWDPLWRDIDRSRGDVGDLHVRSVRRRTDHLLMHERDPDAGLFVLVLNELPDFTILGCCYGHEGKRSEHWRSGIDRPCYFVPRTALRPLSVALAGGPGAVLA